MFDYYVQPGDNLYRIADYFDVSVGAILSANPGLNPNTIYVGQLIRIPISRYLYQQYPWYYLYPNVFIRFPRHHWDDRRRWPGGWRDRDGGRGQGDWRDRGGGRGQGDWRDRGDGRGQGDWRDRGDGRGQGDWRGDGGRSDRGGWQSGGRGRDREAWNADDWDEADWQDMYY